VPYQVFEVDDGHLIVAVGNDSQFRQFCNIIGQSELANDPKFASNEERLHNRDELIGLLLPIIKQMTKNDLLAKMEANGVPGGPINTLDEVFDSDQVRARNMKISMPHSSSVTGQVDLIGNPLKLSKTPVSYRRAPPERGADTDDVLQELDDLLQQN
jgi:crotonobetainyl-CoA:carnitine CoA-transferase CaiB-like acyl-CoA transferase